MIAVLTLFVILIFLLLVGFAVAGYLAWRKIEAFLTWNTRYNSSAYEQAVAATGKFPKPKLDPVKTENRGRQVKHTDELVDLTELEFDKAFDAVAQIGQEPVGNP
jgi:uncharacterized protein YneF (UPF0154 family)